MRRRGVAIGEEFRGKGVNIHLGPSVGPLGRKPRGGRSMYNILSQELIAKVSIQTGKASAQILSFKRSVEP
jgi:hypothetical protein